LNRLALAAEWRNVRAATAWVGEAAGAWQRFKPWLVLAAPLAGVLAGLGARRPVGAVSRLFRILRWARMLRSVWKGMTRGASSTESQ
jgi:hypothetical protein